MLKGTLIFLVLLYITCSCLAKRSFKKSPFKRSSLLRRRFRGDISKKQLVTVDAAYCLQKGRALYLYLFIGNDTQILRNGRFFAERPIKHFHFSKNMQVQAVFLTTETHRKRIFYGPKYGKFVTKRGKRVRHLKYGPARAFIRNGGPDAAARKSGKIYVFKGCEMAVRKDWNDWEKPVNVTTLGLPCGIHAAWKEKEEMVVLKGIMIWRWKEDNTVEGPKPFESSYRLKRGCALKPTSD